MWVDSEGGEFKFNGLWGITKLTYNKLVKLLSCLNPDCSSTVNVITYSTS